jgi:uncharacterized protein (UPF0218 family)
MIKTYMLPDPAFKSIEKNYAKLYLCLRSVGDVVTHNEMNVSCCIRIQKEYNDLVLRRSKFIRINNHSLVIAQVSVEKKTAWGESEEQDTYLHEAMCV